VVELIPDSYLARLNLDKIFGRIAPLHVDLGCGDGEFLGALAERHPHENFLGIERISGRVAKACRKARTLGNVRILHLETSYGVRYLFPESSVTAFYLLFPDPWPKRRHRPRRIVTRDFLGAIKNALEENGFLRIATDDLGYLREIERVTQAAQRDGLKWPRSSGLKVVPLDDVDLPVSKFERRFREAGARVYRLSLRKTSPET
jgi:tRNA (guanine-N7-)-methyltransferase